MLNRGSNILALAVCISLLGACGDEDGSEGGGGSAAPTTAASEPEGTAVGSEATSASSAPESVPDGGRITVATFYRPNSFDPALSKSGTDYVYQYLIYDRLINLDPENGEPVPGLAESWQVGSDGLTYVLELRAGVTFQDGTPLDAEAVVSSLLRYQAEGQQSDLANVTGVAATGPLQVTLTLSAPDAILPTVLADRAGMIVSPTAVDQLGEGFAQAPVGAGPYRLASQSTGASVTFEPYVGYWNRDARPHLDALVFNIYDTSAAMVSALRSRVADLGLEVPATDVDVLEGTGDLEIVASTSPGFKLIALNTGIEPTSSVQIRQAINLAIDREQLLEVVFDGRGSVAYQPVQRGHVYYDDDLDPTWEFDPDAARDLVTESGLADVSMECVVLPGYGYETAGPIIQQNLADVGIDIELRMVTVPEALQAFVEDKTAPCFLANWSGRPDPAITIKQLFASDAVYNPGGTDYGIGAALDELVAIADPAVRGPAISSIIAELTSAAPYVPLYSDDYLVAVGTDVGGFVPALLSRPDLRTLYVES